MADKNIKIKLDYSEFSGGITECQGKMQLLTSQFKLQQAELGNNASKVDELSLAQSTLTQKIGLQAQVVQQAAEKVIALSESESASVAQIEAAHRALLKQETVLQEMKNELESTTEELNQLSEAEQQVGNDVEGATSKFDGFLSAINGLSAVTNTVSSVTSAISNMARTSASTADSINTMATQFGVSAQTMDQWVAIQEKTDVSAQTLGSSLSRLTRTMGEAADGSSEAKSKFSSLGVSITDSSGHLRNAESVFYEIIDALGGISNPAERDATAMELLGRSAQELNPIIQMGADNFRAMAESSQGVIPDGFESRLNGLSDAFADFDTSLEYGQNLLIGSFAPAISTVLSVISSLDPSILGVVSAFKLAFEIVSSLSPVITMLNTAFMAHAATVTADTAAQEANIVATETETVAETGLAASAAAATVAMLPQIAVILAIVAAAALLAAAIYAIVEAFNDEADAADNANASLEKMSGIGLDTNAKGTKSSIATSRYALGSTVGGAGGLAWVGEQGAELVNLPAGSTVYNHEESKNMSTNSSVNNYYVTIDAKNVNDFNKVVSIFNGLGQSMNRGGLVNG